MHLQCKWGSLSTYVPHVLFFLKPRLFRLWFLISEKFLSFDASFQQHLQTPVTMLLLQSIMINYRRYENGQCLNLFPRDLLAGKPWKFLVENGLCCIKSVLILIAVISIISILIHRIITSWEKYCVIMSRYSPIKFVFRWVENRSSVNTTNQLGGPQQKVLKLLQKYLSFYLILCFSSKASERRFRANRHYPRPALFPPYVFWNGFKCRNAWGWNPTKFSTQQACCCSELSTT